MTDTLSPAPLPSQTPEQAVAALDALLEQHRGEKHIVVLQNYPDPDAIACAWAHRRIAMRYDIDCTMMYAGKISHQQNLALVNILKVPLVRYDETIELREFQGSVFVDNQGTTSSLTPKLQEAGVPPLVVVDHHELQEMVRAPFMDIRRIGACATIYVEYIRRGLLELDRERTEHVRLSTALMHAIQSETNGFITARQAEFDAAAYLSGFYDADALTQISSQSRSHVVMEIIGRALANRDLRDNYSLSGIGYLRADDRDAIPQAADFLLSEEDVHTALVFGLVNDSEGNESIIGSLRTIKATLDPDELLKSAFGRGQQGQFFGGGKETAGGFEIPVGFLSGLRDADYQEMKWQVFHAQIRQRFFERLGLNKAPKAPPTRQGTA